MPKLYVDVDDTLIIWLDEKGCPLAGPNPCGGGSQKWIFNNELLMNVFLDWKSGMDIVLWSGGGQAYAQSWLNRIARSLEMDLPWTALAKNRRSIESSGEKDIAVDDIVEAIVGFQGKIYLPHEYIHHLPR